jgi:hypothetical protein
MSEDERPPRPDVVDVLVPVNVVEVASSTPFDERRSDTEGAERSDRRVDSPGNSFLRRLEELFAMFLHV